MLLSAFAPRLLPLPRPVRRRQARPAQAAAGESAATLAQATPGPARQAAPAAAPALPPSARTGIREVLVLLRDQLGLEAVYVREHDEAGRRYRLVEALRHGPAAACATGQGGEGDLLQAPVLVAGLRPQGALCCLAPSGTSDAERERLLRLLRHGARLAGRLLDNEAVLRDLARHADGA